MNFYRIVFCGTPIKRWEYIVRTFFLVLCMSMTIALEKMADHPDFTQPWEMALMIMPGLLVVSGLLDIFWTYWRIRDCIADNGTVVLALIASFLIPVLPLIWVFWPSRQVSSEDHEQASMQETEQ